MGQILLLDDDPLQLRVREKVLRMAGFPVSIATNADSALALLHAAPLASAISVIITDHVLSGATGADFVRQVRRLKPAVPVVVVTGMHGIEENYAGLDVIFRQKPCPPQELISLVRALSQRAA